MRTGRLATIADLDEPEHVVNDLMRLASVVSNRYDEWIEEHAGDAHQRAPGIHASELKCLRKVVYSCIQADMVGENRKFWRQRFQFGKYIHLLFQDDFEQLAAESGGRIRFVPEVRIAPHLQALAAEYDLQSSCDGIFEFYDEDCVTLLLRIALEIKSESPLEFKKLTEPRPEHVVQAHFYMRVLDVPMVWFLYVDRGSLNNTQSMTPWLVKYDHATGDKVLTMVNRATVALKRYREDETLPVREEGIQCQFCSSRDVCQPDFNKSKSKRRL